MKNDNTVVLHDHNQDMVKSGKNGKKLNSETDWNSFLRNIPLGEFTNNGTLGVLVRPLNKTERSRSVKIFEQNPGGDWQCIHQQVVVSTATHPEFLGEVKFLGEVYEAGNVSALGIVGDLLLIGSDEGNKVQIFKRQGNRYRLIQEILLNEDGSEVDIEGIACENDIVYIVGSHSWKRPKMKVERTYEKNRKMLEQVLFEESRDYVFEFRIDAEGKVVGNIRKTSLRSIIRKNKVLRVFSRVPGKENGVDIEGIAVKNGLLYFGFRGPVLRGNYVPVLVSKFSKELDGYELMYVNMGGRGIRDIVSTSDGFLVLGGPVGDGPGSYQLYFWDGRDCVSGKRENGEPTGQCVYLCEIPTAEGAKAEGVTITKENNNSFEFLIVYDSVDKGGARRYRVSKPAMTPDDAS